jgi:hypothetical protein
MTAASAIPKRLSIGMFFDAAIIEAATRRSKGKRAALNILAVDQRLFGHDMPTRRTTCRLTQHELVRPMLASNVPQNPVERHLS